MKVRSDWFTSVRVRRLAEVLVAISSLPPELSDRDSENVLWRKCGGPQAEIRPLIDVLIELKVVRTSGQNLARTQAGHQIARAIRNRNEDLLALSLIRAGYFHDQARILLESGVIDEVGNLRCPTRFARIGAPQLLGILEKWDEVQLFPEVFIPDKILQELNSVWALLPPPIEIPKWAAERKEVGNRAEMYTVQYEKTRVGTASIFWVARDSDALGWDVEDRSVTPYKCIEVKGRRESDVLFYLSENEWGKAQALGANYEVQFWGGIDLAVDPATEYSLLRANGYPLIISNLSEQLGQSWQAVAVNWKITPIPTTVH
jgi:uncharacterized protein DUF3883